MEEYSRMFRRLLAVVALSGLFGSILPGCNSLPPVPPAEQFTQMPVGTPIPYDQHGAPVTLPPGMSGAMFINQMNTPIRVAVSDTITTVVSSQAFLFILPPGAYQFYVYEVDGPNSARTETLTPGKVRYVYLLPIVVQ
jgi:hypothetical protein